MEGYAKTVLLCGGIR